MGRLSQHVVPRLRGWSVWKSGSSRATKNFSTREEAIAAARDLARRQRTDLYIHGQDGRVREKDSYRTDSFPHRG